MSVIWCCIASASDICYPLQASMYEICGLLEVEKEQ